jgi:uncharacterized repeat protein (TIGR03847 family)
VNVPNRIIELNPVSRITCDAVGVPGQRTFYLQARKGNTLLTILCEKEQINMLGKALKDFLNELKVKYPKGSNYNVGPLGLNLESPIEPDFRAGQMGLGYDEDKDLIILVIREILGEDENEDDVRVARLFGSRAQMDALSQNAVEIVSRGRPICPLCGKPMDSFGNVEGFCPRRNGHGDEVVFA